MLFTIPSLEYEQKNFCIETFLHNWNNFLLSLNLERFFLLTLMGYFIPLFPFWADFTPSPPIANYNTFSPSASHPCNKFNSFWYRWWVAYRKKAPDEKLSRGIQQEIQCISPMDKNMNDWETRTHFDWECKKNNKIVENRYKMQKGIPQQDDCRRENSKAPSGYWGEFLLFFPFTKKLLYQDAFLWLRFSNNFPTTIKSRTLYVKLYISW